MSVNVCLSACISPESHAQSSPEFSCMLPVSVARSSSAALRYVMYFLFMNDVIFAHEKGARKGVYSA